MSRNLAQRRNELIHLFIDDHRLIWERNLGSGSSGFTVLFKDVDAIGNIIQRLVVKRGIDEDDDIDIAQERNWLEILREDEHIVNLVAISNNPLEDRNDRGGLRGEWIMMEYMENGTLDQFIERIEGITLPNRVLLFIFLCMTRACLAMAYPSSNEMPVERIQPTRLAHIDMKFENCMFGRLDGDKLEHSLVPILKLIDFGFAREMPPSAVNPLQEEVDAYDNQLGLGQHRVSYGVRNPGIERNILDIGMAMTRILTSEKLLSVARCRQAIQMPDIHPRLLWDLRLLIARCLAVDPLNRPPLEQLIASLHGGMFTIGDISMETDDSIKDFIHEYILSADT
ncbi:kinase-like domain-containing protein [Annulohypoxylon moriforme]|nr:kinase-like domain-containing protein [Annulohypoxylon moriforme]